MVKHAYQLTIQHEWVIRRYSTAKKVKADWQSYYKDGLGIKLLDSEIKVTYLGKESEAKGFPAGMTCYKMLVIITRSASYWDRKPIALVGREWREAYKKRIGLPLFKREITVTYLGEREVTPLKAKASRKPKK